MEFCLASLDHLFLQEGDLKKYNIDSMPPHEQVFLQLVNGLKYIHDNDLVHGSIKPSNVMNHAIKDPQIKLANFGLIQPQWDKVFFSRGSSPVSNSGFQSDHYWLAPELLTGDEGVAPTKESDIFATGKVFFYYYHLFFVKQLINLSDGTKEHNLSKCTRQIKNAFFTI